MFVGILTLSLRIPENHSLKGKRMYLKSLKERLRNRFNIAVAEIDHHDKWQLSTMGVVTLSTDKRHIDSMLSQVIEFTKGYRLVELVDYTIKII